MQTERKNNSKLHKNRTYLPGTICKSANELINHNQTAKCKLSIGAKNWKLIGLTRRIMPSVEDDDNLVRWFHSPASGFVLNVFFYMFICVKTNHWTMLFKYITRNKCELENTCQFPMIDQWPVFSNAFDEEFLSLKHMWSLQIGIYGIYYQYMRSFN